MVKLVEGDEMWQLLIELCGVPAYCMNVEECMNIEAKIDGKPWYHDIKAYIKDREYPFGATNNEKKFIRCRCANFSWVRKSCTRGTTTQLFFDAWMPLRLTIWWKRCIKACLEPMLVDPYWLKKLWELVTIGSPWKATALSTWGRATISKSIRIERIFLPNRCTL